MENFLKLLRALKEAQMKLDDAEAHKAGALTVDEAWDRFLTARIDAEQAITTLAEEEVGFYVLAQIRMVHVGGVE